MVLEESSGVRNSYSGLRRYRPISRPIFLVVRFRIDSFIHSISFSSSGGLKKAILFLTSFVDRPGKNLFWISFQWEPYVFVASIRV